MNKRVSCRITLFYATTALFIILSIVYVVHTILRFPLPRTNAATQPGLKPICSFNVVKDIARSRNDGFISGNGTWYRNGHGMHFEPEICRFRYQLNIPSGEVLQCIKRQGLRYVVFAGDSNSVRYFAAFQTLLTGVGASCSFVQVSVLSLHE